MKKRWILPIAIATCLGLMSGTAQASSTTVTSTISNVYCANNTATMAHFDDSNGVDNYAENYTAATCSYDYVDEEASLFWSYAGDWPPTPHFCAYIGTLGGWYVQSDTHATWNTPWLSSNCHPGYWESYMATSSNRYSSFGYNVTGMGSNWTDNHNPYS